MDPRLSQAALGALSQDPSFVAHFGQPEEQPDDPATNPESLAAADPPADANPETPPVKLAGKYDTVEALVEGHEHAQSHITNLSAENKALRDALALLNKGEQPAPEPEDDPLAELDQYGIPRPALERAIEKTAARTVQQFFKPMLEMAQATEDFNRTHPEFAQHAPSVEQFVRSTPQVQAVVEALASVGKIKEAKEYAWTSFRVANASKIEAPTKASAAVTNAARDAAKRNAGVGTTQKGTSRTPVDERAERMKANRTRLMSGSRSALGAFTADLIGLPDDFGKEY